ncbi:MAG: hypothetical protein ACREUK_08380 [Burkholderiales bacterium]
MPDLRATLVASLIGRLPVGMTGLAVLLMVRSSSGSFASAGAANACYITGLAALAPVAGRIIDRQRPHHILLACSALNSLSLVALVVLIQIDAFAWAWLLLAASAGASFPPITVCMRTLFRRRLGDNPLLPTPYSLESVIVEAIFIAGPMLVAVFIAVSSDSLAVLFAAVCRATGTQLFMRSPALRNWKVESSRRPNLLRPLASPPFLSLLAIILRYSIAFGLIEIGVIGFTAEAGSSALAGILLALMSVGSTIGGLVYGTRSWHIPIARQFSLTLALMGCGIVPLAWLVGVWEFAGIAVLAGVVMAPALAMQKYAGGQDRACGLPDRGIYLVGYRPTDRHRPRFAVGGAILEATGSATVFITAAVASLLGAAGPICIGTT